MIAEQSFVVVEILSAYCNLWLQTTYQVGHQCCCLSKSSSPSAVVTTWWC